MFAFFSLKLKKGTQDIKGDPNSQKGPLGDPGTLKGTHCVTVYLFLKLGPIKLSIWQSLLVYNAVSIRHGGIHLSMQRII